jgi:hypothetical protein
MVAIPEANCNDGLSATNNRSQPAGGFAAAARLLGVARLFENFQLSEDGYSTECPVCDSDLRLTVDADGFVVARCAAGCTTWDIMDHLGVHPAVLRPSWDPTSEPPPAQDVEEPADEEEPAAAELPALADEGECLLDAILDDLKALGIAGEDKAGLTLYVVGSSRKRQRPLSALIQGESATGKSYLVNQVASLMPPEEVVKATTMSPQSLYYMPEPVAHKFVVGGERSRVQDDATADQTAALRQLRSESRITKQVTLREGNGFRTKAITVEGPIAHVESTTLAKAIIFPEDLSRALFVQTDATEPQTRRVLQTMARPYLPEAAPADTAAIVARHHQFQRSLEAIEVVIPYAAVLAEKLPATQAQARRSFAQVLAMIETIAFLHQHHRPRDEAGRLVATATDYGAARQLLLKPLQEALGLSGKAKALYARLRHKVGVADALHTGQFSSAEFAEAGGFKNEMTTGRWLARFRGLELLVCVEEAQGTQPALWRWTGRSLDELVLPTVDEVCRPDGAGPRVTG